MINFNSFTDYLSNIPQSTVLMWFMIFLALLLLNSTRENRKYLKQILTELLGEESSLFVGNVDYQISTEELKKFFAVSGQIESVNIPVNRNTGKPRGYGFVTFSSSADAKRALKLDGTELNGRALQISFSKGKAN